MQQPRYSPAPPSMRPPSGALPRSSISNVSDI